MKLYTLFGLSAALCCVTNGIPPYALAAEQAEREAVVVRNLLEAEKKIEDVEAHFSAVLVEKNRFPNYEFDWGYSKGREFLNGSTNSTETEDPDDDKIYQHALLHMTFDGNSMRTLRIDPERSKSGYPAHARIGPLDSASFKDFLTPGVLLGFDIHESGRFTLGEAISQAKSFCVKEETELVDGRQCLVLEVIGVEFDPEVEYLGFDARVWIDAERGYRPMKIEKYESIPGENRWKALRKRIHGIRLECFDGVWFPIEGIRSHFSARFDFPRSMSKEEIEKAPITELRQRATIRIEPEPFTRHVKISPDTVKINNGIPMEKFQVEFPYGCRVWDEFLQVGYGVGSDESGRPSPDATRTPQTATDGQTDGTQGSQRSLPQIGTAHQPIVSETPSLMSEADGRKMHLLPILLCSLVLVALAGLFLAFNRLRRRE
jgi:hypothetical protein